jgi:hypothetical protein
MKRSFQKGLRALALATVTLGSMALLASSGSALILDPSVDPTDKDPEKLRADIQKQQSKFVDCIVKAALKCEKNGVAVSPPECDISTANDSTPADDDTGFSDDIVKCESKVNYSKKVFGDVATDYDAIGCPGDSVPGGSDQPFTDLNAYQAGANASAKDQVETLAAVLAGAAADPSVCGTDPDPNKCGNDIAKRTAGYAKGLFKCLGKCENDHKDKKGDGGDTDGANCALDPDGALPYTAGNVNFNACVTKAREKADKKGGFPGPVASIVGLVHSALNDANNDVFNENEVCP